jgi:hypothetical protein
MPDIFYDSTSNKLCGLFWNTSEGAAFLITILLIIYFLLVVVSTV